MRRQVVHARNADKTDFAREENVGNRAVYAFPRGEILRAKSCLRNMDGCTRVTLSEFTHFFASLF